MTATLGAAVWKQHANSIAGDAQSSHHRQSTINVIDVYLGQMGLALPPAEHAVGAQSFAGGMVSCGLELASAHPHIGQSTCSECQAGQVLSARQL